MPESVYCLGCGGEFNGDADPYPLSNGMCAKCVREARRPVASILAENERLREALRGVLTGRVVLDETEDGQPILLDLSTDPATVVRVNDAR